MHGNGICRSNAKIFKDAKLELAYVANKNEHWEQIADLNVVPVADRLTYVQNENSSAP